MRAAVFCTVLPVAVIAGRPSRLIAQSSVLQIQHYSADDGLAQNTTRAVVQDSAGYIWVATSRGLQRFDGYSFVSYADLDPRSAPELSDLIWALRRGANGVLWVETADALFWLDPATPRATRLPVEIYRGAWAPDSSGNVWILKSGVLKRIDVATDGIQVHAADSSVAWKTLSLVATGRRGDIWLAGPTSEGSVVVRVSTAQRRASSYKLESIVSPTVLLEDPDGRVWVAGDGGVEVLDPGAERVRVLPDFRGMLVNTLEVEGRNRMLVPTSTSLVRVDLQGRLMEEWDSPETFSFIPQDLTVDRDGGFWLASYAGGLFRLDTRRPVFEHLSHQSAPLVSLGTDFVTALTERRDGTLWIGTLRDGVHRLSADGRRADAYRHDPRVSTTLAANHVWDFEEDDEGNLWVGTVNGVCRQSGRAFSCHRSREGSGVVDMAKSPDGWFWFAKNGAGVISFHPSTGVFGRPVSLGDESVMAVLVDPDSSVLWMGGTALFRATVSGGTVVDQPRRVEASVAPDRVIYAMFRDAQHVIWLASENGLQRWDALRERFAPVDVPELRGTTVFSVQEDSQGRLWLGTAHGLVLYSPASGIARRYRREDGIRSGEFNRRAALRSRAGEMLFGGVQGITRFHPDVVSSRRDTPPIAITRVRRLTARGIEEAPSASEETSSVRIVPGDRALTIDFASLSFEAGPARRYRYRLEGLSDDWIESSDHVVTYPTPAPGHYVFRVQAAAGSEGTWSATNGTLAIDVVPPVWRSAWFRGALAAALAAMLWTLHRLRLTRALATERLRLRISRDLHDEIGAGLSSIALLSDAVGKAGTLTDRERTHLRKIGGVARGMVGDLRDIVWSIDPEADHLENVVTRMRDVSSDLLRGFNVTFQGPQSPQLTRPISMTVRRDLLLLFKELIHNVARHSRATAVRIELNIDQTGIALVVADDGVGFDTEQSSSGTGLKSLRERADRLGARFDLHSERGRGTTARLVLEAT